MRVIMVAWRFPPENVVASLRTGKMARRWLERGIDLTVVTPRKDDPSIWPDQSLTPEIPAARVIETDYVDLDARLNPLTALRRLAAPFRGDAAASEAQSSQPIGSQPMGSQTLASRSPASHVSTADSAKGQSALRRALGEVWRHGALFPDRYLGWRPHLRAALERLTAAGPVDAIYVSAPPFSQIAPIARLAARRRIPLFVEMRDLWADEPFPFAPSWRRRWDARAEARLLRDAAGIVTVSEPWAQHFRLRYGRPSLSAMNGYDPADFSFVAQSRGGADPKGPLEIVYAGSIYAGRRDPTPLFQALARGGFTPEDVRVVFHTAQPAPVRAAAEAASAADFVATHDPIPYRDALRRQRGADVLLLLQWTHPANRGNVPAKVFEQLALRRPILGIGPAGGVPASLVTERRAGVFANAPEAIAAQLRAWLAEKRRDGRVADLPASVADGLDRDAQADRALDFVLALVGVPNRSAAALRLAPA